LCRILFSFALLYWFQGEGQSLSVSAILYFKLIWIDEMLIFTESRIVQWQNILYIAVVQWQNIIYIAEAIYYYICYILLQTFNDDGYQKSIKWKSTQTHNLGRQHYTIKISNQTEKTSMYWNNIRKQSFM
jgi:hypothetical protein